MPTDNDILGRIEDKIIELSEKVSVLIAKESILERTINKQEHEISLLKAAHNKALGILTFLTFPGVALTLWMGLQLYQKTP
jgi:predicted regulator of Ras-like GTPase activity (Roadblock/LC7/MglB family)